MASLMRKTLLSWSWMLCHLGLLTSPSLFIKTLGKKQLPGAGPFSSPHSEMFAHYLPWLL
jgi:hypothetical protein